MTDTTTPHDDTHPLDWRRVEVSVGYCERHEYYSAVTINPRRHALRKAIYDLNEANRWLTA